MRRFVRLGALSVLLTTLVTTIFVAPAQAANPYTPEAACQDEFGGSWHVVIDGHRNLVTASGSKWGDVYLLYNNATGSNCVTTIKGSWVGTATWTAAALAVEGLGWIRDDLDYYKYYAAVQYSAAGKCVQYEGLMDNPGGTDSADGGRFAWGNCG